MAVPEPLSCPKCGAPRLGEPACPRCGLKTARMGAFSRTRDASVPDALVAAWDGAVAGWDEPARHDELLRLVAQHDAYAWAAARYRTRAGDPIGDRQLERVRKSAEVTLFATRATVPDKTPRPYRATIAVLVMLIIVAIAGMLYAMAIREEPDSPPDPAGHLRIRPLPSRPLPPGK